MQIKQYDLKKIFSINEDIEINEHSIDDLYYVTIDNFFKNPDDLVDFLIQFPTSDVEKQIKDNHDDISENIKVPPGIQQLLHPTIFEQLSFNLIGILAEANFIPNKNDKRKKNDASLANQLSKFIYYTNYIGPESVSFRNNNFPHIDQYKFSFNFHLSKDVNSALSFYNLKESGKLYSGIKSIMKESPEIREKIRDKLNKTITHKDNSIDKFKSITENDIFKLYEECEFKYNRLVIYEGSYWHSIKYDANTEKNPRYSLVSAYNFDNDENL